MAQFVSDCLRTMRLTIGRRNENDPDSNDNTLLQYINDFVNLTMSDDVKLFEQFGTLRFTIDQTNPTGVYPFNGLTTIPPGLIFTNISQEAFITLTNPPEGSISWNQLLVYQDPGTFFYRWGVNNANILIPGYPTEMLFYGNEFTFRTIPNTQYDIIIYGYKVVPNFTSVGDPALPYDYWMRYISYGAGMNYARDYRFENDKIGLLNAGFQHERKLLLTRTHNQIKQQRAFPRF